MIEMRRRCSEKELLIPAEYQQVEYLESTGTQFIQTNISASIPPEYYRIKAMIKKTENNKGSGYLDGARGINPNSWLSIAQYDNVNKTVVTGYGNSWSVINDFILETDVYYDIVGIFIVGEYPIYIVNDISYGFKTYNIVERTVLNKKFSLFARYQSHQEKWEFGIGRICEYIIGKNSDEFIAHLIPCYRKVDNVPGMYDRVNGVFYTNSGTGEFIVGPDVN